MYKISAPTGLEQGLTGIRLRGRIPHFRAPLPSVSCRPGNGVSDTRMIPSRVPGIFQGNTIRTGNEIIPP